MKNTLNFHQCQRCRFGSCSEEDQHSDLNHLKLSNCRGKQTFKNLYAFVAVTAILLLEWVSFSMRSK